MCPVVAELCWSGPFRSRPRSIPVPDRGHPCTTPDPLPDKPLSRRWDLRDRSQAEWTASHGSQWVTLATGCVLASARALAMQGKPALNRCTTKMPCRWSENERQPAWVASTCISLRCKLYTYIQYIYILYLNLSICLLIYDSIYICLYVYSLYFITLQRSGTRPVTQPLCSICPEHRGTFHTQFWFTAICRCQDKKMSRF